MGNVVACHDQVLSSVILATDDNVSVRMAGVEMIDRDPVELSVKVDLHLPDEVADERFQVSKLGAVISGNNEAELVRIVCRSVEKGSAIDVLARSIIEPARPTVPRNAIAQDVPQVCLCRAKPAARDGRVASLHDNAAAIRRDKAEGGAHAGTHPTPEACGRNPVSPLQRAAAVFAGFAQYAGGVPLGGGATCSADASQLAIEFVVGHRNGLHGC